MLPEELRRKAVDEARRRGISFGGLIREALRAVLEEAPRKASTDSLLSDRKFYYGEVPADYSARLSDYRYGDKK